MRDIHNDGRFYRGSRVSARASVAIYEMDNILYGLTVSFCEFKVMITIAVCIVTDNHCVSEDTRRIIKN